MSNTKHTSGPWAVKKINFATGTSCWIQTESQVVCRLNCDEYDSVISFKANAKLIAAAPEMLDALQYVRGELLLLEEDTLYNRALVTIEAAIKKATE